MRDFSADHRWLSLNTATVRKQGDLTAIIEACARHGIRAIDPWRDQVAAIGLDRAVRAVRDAGLELSGYCRGGMFTADAAHRIEARDDNRRAVDEARALGAPCIVLVAGGLPQYSRPGSAASKDIAAARMQVRDAIAEMLEYAKQASMPLAIEPLHPAYAADRACVNTTKQALDICDQLDPRRTASRRATTIAVPSTKPRRWARPASCWSSAACRNIRARAVLPRRISWLRARRCTTPSPRCWNTRKQPTCRLRSSPCIRPMPPTAPA